MFNPELTLESACDAIHTPEQPWGLEWYQVELGEKFRSTLKKWRDSQKEGLLAGTLFDGRIKDPEHGRIIDINNPGYKRVSSERGDEIEKMGIYGFSTPMVHKGISQLCETWQMVEEMLLNAVEHSDGPVVLRGIKSKKGFVLSIEQSDRGALSAAKKVATAQTIIEDEVLVRGYGLPNIRESETVQVNFKPCETGSRTIVLFSSEFC